MPPTHLYNSSAPGFENTILIMKQLLKPTKATIRACTRVSFMGPSAGVWPRALHLVYTLCEMLNTMIDTPCLRQDTLSVLAVDANLVPRLWCGALKVCAHHCRMLIASPTRVLKYACMPDRAHASPS